MYMMSVVSGGAQGRFRPGGPVNPPTAGTTPPQGNRPRPASQPPGNTGTPAGGQPTDGQQGEPMFVQMLRTMLSGAVSSNYKTSTIHSYNVNYLLLPSTMYMYFTMLVHLKSFNLHSCKCEL